MSNVVIDSIMAIIVIVVISLTIFFGWAAFDDIRVDVRNDVDLNESKATIDEVENRYPPLFDGVIVFVFLGMWAFGIIAAILKDDHPVLFGFFMFALIFVIIAGAMLGNFVEELFQDELLEGVTENFSAGYWILSHLLELGIVMGISILLVVLGKNRA